MKTQTPHAWTFVRLGGLDQVVIQSGEDLLHLHELDQKLWVALACPVNGLEIDVKTLELIDRDKDGRIRVPEILAAIKWAAPRLKDLGLLLESSSTLPLSAINPNTPEGARILASATAILEGMAKEDQSSISLSDIADQKSVFAATRFNGDGVVTVNTAENDPELQQVIQDILATVGGEQDRSGAKGVDQAKSDAFFDACAAYQTWLATGKTADVQTLGAATGSAAAAVEAVRAKVDDFFARTRLAAFDDRAIAALNHSESEYLTLVAQDLSITAQEVAGFPLARIVPGGSLPLLESVNPAWEGALAQLHKDAVAPVFGASTRVLTAAQWEELKTKVAPYLAWQTGKTGDIVASLGEDRLAEILKGPIRTRLNDLITADKDLESEFQSISDVEKLLRYRRDFATLLRNFVNFLDFYSLDRLGIFQAGTLYLDSRSTDLCVKVEGASPLAAMSKTYIAYCDCTRPGKPPMKIAACFTQGDSDFLFVGRNGIFYDRDGNDWDAKITALVDNPISIRQAFFQPYKKFVRMIEEHAAKRAAAAEAKADEKLNVAADKSTDVAALSSKTPTPPKKVDVGTVAALGVATSAGITALTLILGYVFGLKFWQYPLLILGLVAVISGPSMIVAWLKLRHRTLAPILEANGWAINGRVKITAPMGNRFTELAKLPHGSHRSHAGPAVYQEDRQRTRLKILLWVVLILALVAAGIRWDALRNDGVYFWQTLNTDEVAPEAGATPAAEEPAP